MYLVDSDVFIQAKNLHYGFDFCPAFWKWLVEQNKRGAVASVDKVAEELKAGNDELAQWVRGRDKGFFLPFDDWAVPMLRKVSDWVNGGPFSPQSVGKFLGGADLMLVAHARISGDTVVTHERGASEEEKRSSTRRIKIPDACEEFNVRWMSPFEMLRQGGARFVLG